MWNEGDPRRELKEHEVSMGRGSEVVVLDDRVIEAAARAQPGVTKINVTKSSRLHIGPKFVSVTQNVDNTEVVKDLPLPRYLWDIAKSTTKAERLSCAAAIVVLLVCIMLIVYFTVIAKKTAHSVVDVAPHEWYITRDMWLAPPFLYDVPIEDKFGPLKLVIVAHTVSAECHLFKNCAAELRNLQSYFAGNFKYDLPYNFLIGNEGRVYEGRGWNRIGAHTRGYNSCTLGIAFIGDYREGQPNYSKVTELQLLRAKMLLEKGVELGYLQRDYHVLGAKDVQSSLSPGTNLYRAIQQWPTYNHDNFYRNKTCEEIHNLNQTTVALETTTLPSTMKIQTGAEIIPNSVNSTDSA